MIGFTTCVGRVDMLRQTLPTAWAHFDRTIVVTSLDDFETIRYVRSFPASLHIRTYLTDAFTSYGAYFNKGLALERAFQFEEPRDWICVFDCDIIMPTFKGLKDIRPVNLYSAPRLIVDVGDPKPTVETGFPGYFHIFHASDPHLEPLPWYDVTCSHAGGGDGFFQSRWPKENKIYLPFNVLHLGPKDKHWFGQGEEAERLMAEQMQRWGKGKPHEQFGERVKVPGHEPREWVYE